MPLHLCFKMKYVFLNYVGGKGIQHLFLFLRTDSLYVILKLIPYRKNFTAMPGFVSIYFWTQNIPVTVQRGWLNQGHLQMHYHIYHLLLLIQYHLQEFKFDLLHHLQNLPKALCSTNKKSIAHTFSCHLFTSDTRNTLMQEDFIFPNQNDNGTVYIM